VDGVATADRASALLMTNGADSPRAEAVNSTIRGLTTVLFSFSVCWGFLYLKLVSGDAFMTIATAVILWWFKDRSDKEKTKEAAALVASAATVPTPAPAPSEPKP
jgi:hypothetical protein